MRTILYTNTNGQTVLFSTDPILTSLKGIDIPDVNIQSQKAPFQDGSTPIDRLFADRTIYVEGKIIRTSSDKDDLITTIYKKRREMDVALNPKFGPGTIVYTNNYGSWQINNVEPDGTIYSNTQIPTQSFQITFTCHDPYLYSLSASSFNLQDTVANTTFPITFSPTIVLSYFLGTTKTLFNNGDWTTAVAIKIIGPCTNPKITNVTTGEYIKIKKTMVAGDVLEINTAFGNKTVYFTPVGGTKVSAMNLLNLGSTFWQLQAGSNSVSLSDDSISTSDICTITYTERYVGA